MLQTPVLFIVFNRPDTTKQVFEAIRQAKPKQLFIAADGPRPNKEGEVIKCEEVRKIATEVDWDCDVKTFFRKENLGCGRGPAEAITWFFEHVDQGIILEDDCLPDVSFFSFCEIILAKYKDNPEIAHIAGTNLCPKRSLRHSYFFSRLVPIWGWATWKRAWKDFDEKMGKWPEFQKENDVGYFKAEAGSVMQVFSNHYKDQLSHSWDGAWAFTCFKNRRLSVIPKKNLIKNIGFGEHATHTTQKDSPFALVKVGSLKFPLIHPRRISPDQSFDVSYLKRLNNPSHSIFERLLLKFKAFKNISFQS